jgi:hypothetical protein
MYQPSFPIFFALLLGLGVSLAAGWAIGHAPKRHAVAGLAASLALVMGLSLIPRFLPAFFPTVLPLELLVWLEGTMAAFPFMVLVGILAAGKFGASWERPKRLLALLGVVYFIFNAIWMVLPDIEPEEEENRSIGKVTLQTRPDTCAPSAAATLLRRMGYNYSEAEMCRIVRARPTRGSTLVRTAYGLRHILDPHGYDVTIEPHSAIELATRAVNGKPSLVTIRSGPAADHMVAVVDRLGPYVIIANPSPGTHGRYAPVDVQLNFGYQMYAIEDFERMHRGAAIVIEPRDFRPRPKPRPIDWKSVGAVLAKGREATEAADDQSVISGEDASDPAVPAIPPPPR